VNRVEVKSPSRVRCLTLLGCGVHRDYFCCVVHENVTV